MPFAYVNGLSSSEEATFLSLLNTLESKKDRNVLRNTYYNAHKIPSDLNISIPKSISNQFRSVLGWPAKAVDIPAKRINWQAFETPASEDAKSIADRIVYDNRLSTELPQTFKSSLQLSCSFLITSKGIAERGETKTLITSKDAINGTGSWNVRKRGLDSFLSVHIRDPKSYKPISATLYLPGENIDMEFVANCWRATERSKTSLNYVPVEPVPYDPSLDRPFGRSRITRPVMYYTDVAARTVMRSEIGAEFYSIPQRWMMGADESAFGNNTDQWKLVVGRMLMLDDDDERTNPRAEVGQFPQVSMTPHMQQLKSLAQLFAGEASIPLSSLGIASENNPTSADAYTASRDDLIAEAESCITQWEGATARAMRTAFRLEGVPDDVKIYSQFRDPRYTSKAAAADAAAKIIGVLPWMAESNAAIEMLGFDTTLTERLKAEKRRLSAASTLETLTGLAE